MNRNALLFAATTALASACVTVGPGRVGLQSMYLHMPSAE